MIELDNDFVHAMQIKVLLCLKFPILSSNKFLIVLLIYQTNRKFAGLYSEIF